DHALDLHDRPPPALMAPSPDTPLEALSVLVLDTETTGLDVRTDRIVAVGAVRLHGDRVYRGVTLDRLVNPGCTISTRSIAIHGITDYMVADAPRVAEVLPDLHEMMRNTVVVGHNIGFDLAMLRRSAGEAGLEWRDPPWLDTLLLAAALEPDAEDFNLESLALRLAVNVSGRHTALGDSFVTAEVYVRLIPRLAKVGVRTWGQAVEFSRRARHILAQQHAAGWWRGA
ncbi:MAG: 3'-5' exonuclease, partial [Rhodospirillales bacterium]|nr:3'-5' exonuclease [Rhodospirillales bacterium]